MVGGRVGYQAWKEFGCVWLELVCHECLGQSGIWTSFDGELCSPPRFRIQGDTLIVTDEGPCRDGQAARKLEPQPSIFELGLVHNKIQA